MSRPLKDGTLVLGVSHCLACSGVTTVRSVCLTSLQHHSDDGDGGGGNDDVDHGEIHPV